MNLLEYSTTWATPYHLFGGLMVAVSVALGAVVTGVFWAVCMLIYQLYDSLPRQCLDWCHTKWDIIEIGFGAWVVGVAVKVVMLLRHIPT